MSLDHAEQCRNAQILSYILLFFKITNDHIQWRALSTIRLGRNSRSHHHGCSHQNANVFYHPKMDCRTGFLHGLIVFKHWVVFTSSNPEHNTRFIGKHYKHWFYWRTACVMSQNVTNFVTCHKMSQILLQNTPETIGTFVYAFLDPRKSQNVSGRFFHKKSTQNP